MLLVRIARRLKEGTEYKVLGTEPGAQMPVNK